MKIIDYINCDNDDIISKESKMIANVLLSGSPYQIYNYKQISDEVYNKYGCYIRFNYLDKTASKKINVSSHTVGQYAGEISELCSKMSLPLISVMIFNGQLPGEGFYTFPLCKELLSKGLTEKEISIEIRNQVAECFENNSWQALIDYLNKKSIDTNNETKINNEFASQNARIQTVSDILRDEFYYFLIKEGFSAETPSGNPSTVYDYQKRIDFVCDIENITWDGLQKEINSIIEQYSPQGIKSELGAKSHNAVIAALKQFKIFVEKNNKKLIDEIEDNKSDIYKETEKQALLKIRIGHSELRNRIFNHKKECEICGIKNNKLLIVSHIKPWSKSESCEKLDESNILLLCSMHDALFDKGLITFDDNGKILISSELDEEEQILVNIDADICIEISSERQKTFLKYHRENVFIK